MIAGLGNPGLDYELSRHNYGFMLIDLLCRRWGVGLSRTTPHAVYEVVRRRQNEVVLIKPITYMNRSGLAVRELMRHFSAAPGELLVAHDELDLELGVVKMRSNCGPGSHNGVSSVVEELGTQDFGRLRLGIGPRPPEYTGADFVLGPFGNQELKTVESVLEHTVSGMETLLARGFNHAMNQINRKISFPEGEEPATNL
jgi:PTH1 family peptidyl-tRNA hydrolase